MDRAVQAAMARVNGDFDTANRKAASAGAASREAVKAANRKRAEAVDRETTQLRLIATEDRETAVEQGKNIVYNRREEILNAKERADELRWERAVAANPERARDWDESYREKWEQTTKGKKQFENDKSRPSKWGKHYDDPFNLTDEPAEMPVDPNSDVFTAMRASMPPVAAAAEPVSGNPGDL